mgnify:CR=1 FL=1
MACVIHRASRSQATANARFGGLEARNHHEKELTQVIQNTEISSSTLQASDDFEELTRVRLVHASARARPAHVRPENGRNRLGVLRKEHTGKFHVFCKEGAGWGKWLENCAFL